MEKENHGALKGTLISEEVLSGGGIKRVTETTFRGVKVRQTTIENSQGQIVFSQEETPDGNLLYSRETTYNEEGKPLITIERYGGESYKGKKIKTVYNYNRRGVEIKQEIIEDEDTANTNK